MIMLILVARVEKVYWNHFFDCIATSKTLQFITHLSYEYRIVVMHTSIDKNTIMTKIQL